MRIVVALDSFKGSLSARAACDAAARGLGRALPQARIVTVPMADGGEGTAETVLASAEGSWVTTEVTGPLPEMTVPAAFAWLPGRGPGAFIEMAKASGIELLHVARLDPLRATTRGTGELLLAALERGAKALWLAIGGSATVDGGTGAARAFGWRFVDRHGVELGDGGGALERLASILPPDAMPLAGVPLDVLCDVDNPLLGPRGAARVFGPQKGATPEAVERLEAGLARLASVIERDIGVDVRALPGAGAAGGLGAGAVAFLGGRLVAGVEAVMDAVGLDGVLSNADWVVTGEGRLDEQSLHGKVVSGVAARGRRAGCRVAVLAGRIRLEKARLVAAGIDLATAATPEEMSLDEASALAAELIERSAASLGHELAAG